MFRAFPSLSRAAFASALLILVTAPARAQGVEAILDEQVQADKEAIASQERIDEIQDETQALVSRYRQALADAESFAKYNRQLEAQVRSQEENIADMNRQLAELDTTNREVFPLMERMVSTLERFVELDVPFLPEERRRRVANLESLLSQSEVTPSEKYRRILEAYQIELDYGRTLDAYEGTVEEDGKDKTVQFVRIGRVALVYQTADGKQTGYWDTNRRAWVTDPEIAHDVREALRVAKKLGAPDLLMVPVPAPEEAKS